MGAHGNCAGRRLLEVMSVNVNFEKKMGRLA
jgi:hypothetical protein